MKNIYFLILAFFFINNLFSQKELIGDTILYSNINGPDYPDIMELSHFADYEFVKAGYTPDSITNEIFILRKNNEHLIIVTEVIKSDSTISNLVLDVIKVKLKDNQLIEFSFCWYKGSENPNIIAVMEEGETKYVYDKTVAVWEILKFKRKVKKAKRKKVECSVDERHLHD